MSSVLAMVTYFALYFGIRYQGDLSVDAVVDWFATTILGLPRILFYSKESLVICGILIVHTILDSIIAYLTCLLTFSLVFQTPILAASVFLPWFNVPIIVD